MNKRKESIEYIGNTDCNIAKIIGNVFIESDHYMVDSDDNAKKLLVNKKAKNIVGNNDCGSMTGH